MDPQLQNEFFKEFEKQVYYDRYFKELRSREDGRKFQQSRKATFILNSLHTAHGNCVLKKGKMLIICEIKAIFQQQFVNALTNKPSSLLKIRVSIPDNRHLTNFQKGKKEAYLTHSVQLQLDKLGLEKQLLTKHKYKTFGYRLQMGIRVLSEDGGVFEHCLLVAQLALQTTKFKSMRIEGDEIKETEPTRVLDFERFIVPITMSQINGQVIVDPSRSEQESMTYCVTNWVDIIGDRHWVVKSGPSEVQMSVILKFQEQVGQQKRDLSSKLNLKHIIAKMLEHPESPIHLQIQI